MTKHRVLVVEDDRLIARDIALQLRVLGHESLGPAHTGQQAIEMAGQLIPDLVLMDVHLEGPMDGIDAATIIRAQFDLPSIFLSAFAVESNGMRAQLARPAGYLSKPFEDYELRESIEAAFKEL
jgi:CheY-like chemotaxis protein